MIESVFAVEKMDMIWSAVRKNIKNFIEGLLHQYLSLERIGYLRKFTILPTNMI